MRYGVEEHGEQGRQRNGLIAFYELLEEMAITHDSKSHDYASNDNPVGNYHFSGQLCLLFKHSPEDAGFVSRIGEKLYRLANLESSGKVPKNESIADTEKDICVITTLWMADRRMRRFAGQPMCEGDQLEEKDWPVLKMEKANDLKTHRQEELAMRFVDVVHDMEPRTITESIQYLMSLLEQKISNPRVRSSEHPPQTSQPVK